MQAAIAIALRELSAYFATPLAYVFLLMFSSLASVFTFHVGSFYARGQADLQPFFGFHPWLYLFLVSAIAMRLWAEERKTGTLELLLTQPVALWAAVLGKFLAGWLFLGLALLMTVPVWLTVNYLGDPDNGAILAAYLGSWLLAGGFLALGCFTSALTQNQVVAFILSAVLCFLFVMTGFPMVLDAFTGWAPAALVDAVASTSLLFHFQDLSRGVLSLADLGYFLVFIAGWLAATAIVIDMKKGG
jgi:ABC-2 type transport system permease protein